jgi:tripeptidyl-peptidase-1
LAVEEYSIPAHIQKHVDFTTPTVHFDLVVKMEGKRTDLEGCDLDATIARHNISKLVPQVHPDPLRVPLSSIKFNLTNCNRYITPEYLQTLYELPNGTAGS